MGIESLLQQNVQSSGLAGVDRLARNAMFPQSQMDKTQYAVSSQMPTSAETIRADYDAPTNAYTGLPDQPFNQGGIATLRYNGDEDGSQVEASTEEAKPPTMAELADQLKTAYRMNANYDDIWKQFAATKEQDPQQWYKHQLDFLGNQVGWQIGQNTGERASALQPQIQNTIEQAKAAGLKEDEISGILESSNQEANMANQRRIAEEAAKGKGWVNQNIPGGWTTVGALAAAAAAPYAYGLMAGEGALGATVGGGGLTAAQVPNLGATLGATGGTAAGTGAGWGSLTAASTGGVGIGAGALGTGVPASLVMPTTGALAGGAAATGAGLTAKQAALAKMGLNMISGGAEQAGTPSPQSTTPVASPAVIPTINRQGLTGYYGASEAPDYRTVGFKPYLSRIRGVPGEETFAAGGIADLGGYSDGGRLLKGPGDGMSDNIPATIADKQPARLADGEFVIPADVVSHLGNGSTDAGAKQLYKMMDKIRKARTGTKKQGKQINPDKYLP